MLHIEIPEFCSNYITDTFVCFSGIPCLSLCYWNSLLTGGFANGQIVIYDSDSGAKMVEIAAHSRCINALDIALQAGLVSYKNKFIHMVLYMFLNKSVCKVVCIE